MAKRRRRKGRRKRQLEGQRQFRDRLEEMAEEDSELFLTVEEGDRSGRVACFFIFKGEGERVIQRCYGSKSKTRVVDDSLRNEAADDHNDDEEEEGEEELTDV